MKNTFSDLWNNGLADVAREEGVRDGDLPKVRASVKAALIRATWCARDGSLEFANDKDQANCLRHARKVVEKEAPKYAHSHLAASMVGQSPTRRSLSAFLNPVTPDTMLSAGFSPRMAEVGDSCPNCGGQMRAVELANSKPGLFCPHDRVCLPLALKH